MATTYTLISATTLNTTSASVVFSSIPATYDDLLVNISGRGNNTGAFYTNIRVQCNSATGTYSATFIYGLGSDGNSVITTTGTTVLPRMGYVNGPDATASTFSNVEIYIPRYTTSINKSIYVASVTENNQTLNAITTSASNYWSGTTPAITSLTFTTSEGSYVSDSSFCLYGIKNS